jgi:hypothetical protein
MIAFTDINNDVIATGADNFTVESFNEKYPDCDNAAVTKLSDVPAGLKYKIGLSNILAETHVNYYHKHTSGTGEAIEDYILTEDLRCYMRALRDQVNLLTGELITGGMMFPLDDGYARFPMSAEDQRNYLGMVVSAASLPYEGEDRLTIKGIDPSTLDTVYLLPEGASAVAMFFGAGMLHVKQCLEDGWVLKDEIMGMTLEELQAWVDIRT